MFNPCKYVKSGTQQAAAGDRMHAIEEKKKETQSLPSSPTTWQKEEWQT